MSDADDLIGLIRRSVRALEPVPSGLPTKGSLRNPVRAVLFDLYGTLFISGAEGPGSAGPAADPGQFRSLLRSCGADGDPEAVLGAFRARILEEHGRMRKDGVDFPEVRIEEIWRETLGIGSVEQARRFAVEFECLVNPVWPMPFAGELLAGLRAAGLTLGLISNAQFFTPLLFHAFFGSSESSMGFDEELVLYSYRLGRAKPSPLLFDRARAVLGKRSIPPENTLFVGNDMDNDVRPAHRAGFQTVLFCGDRRSLRTGRAGPEAVRGLPDLFAADLEGLWGILKGGPDQGSIQRTS